MANKDDFGWRAWFIYPDGEIYTTVLKGKMSIIEAVEAAHEEEIDHSGKCFKLQSWRRDADHFCQTCGEPITPK